MYNEVEHKSEHNQHMHNKVVYKVNIVNRCTVK